MTAATTRGKKITKKKCGDRRAAEVTRPGQVEVVRKTF